MTFGNLYKLLLASSSQDGSEDTLGLILKLAEKKIGGLDKAVQEEQLVNLETCKLYLERDFRRMPDKTRMNVVANLSSFLQLFLTSEALRMFSPKRSDASFGNIRELIDSGKILALDMTQNDRPGLCRAVGTLLKLSYQNAVMSRLAGGQTPERLACLIMDEYQNFATSSHGETQFGDDRFFDQCRAAKGFGILATQSYATLTMVLKKEAAAHELLGQIAHKITFATDEPSTCAYFRRLAGKQWVKRHSESISESSSNARKTLFQDGLTTEKSSVGLSYSTSEVEVDAVKDEDIAKLPPFKAFAALKMADKPKTHYLYTRPLFDPAPHKPFRDLASRLSIVLLCVVASVSAKAVVPPNICEAVNAGAALSCFGIRQGSCTCHSFGIPYPCVRVTYWVPKTFVEVSPRIGESYFSMIPIVQAQLLAGFKTWNWGVNQLGAMGTGLLNVGEVDDNGSSFFHAHTAPVLLSHEVLKGLPCGSPGYSLPCLSAMSEHHPLQWSTGYFDFKQPQLAGTQLCGGAVDSVGSVVQSARRLLDGPIGDILAGAGIPDFASPEGAGCSIPLAATLGSIKPSSEMPCVGSLGSVFPRYGTVNGPTNVSGALAAAYKFRSLADEHFGTVPKGGTEKWQMVRPKISGCFFPGENLFMVEGVFTPSIRDQFLFLVWEKRSCCVDYLRNGFGLAFLSGVKATCAAMGGR
ncbi:MAG: type IV secretion system DNA-binding domain-containing protein [Deltaproteobacteria bacterium]|nr:type IV secretion system DNA-binding domain-containing protein [Deltaproteobacteria bacterium]